MKQKNKKTEYEQITEILEKQNIKKTKYEQITEFLKKQGYIIDQQAVKFFGEEKLYYNSEYIRKWKKLQLDREFFADKEIIEKKKGRRCHLVRIKGDDYNKYYKVGKEFYKELNI